MVNLFGSISLVGGMVLALLFVVLALLFMVLARRLARFGTSSDGSTVNPLGTNCWRFFSASETFSDDITRTY